MTKPCRIAINLSPHVQLLMNLLRQKVSFFLINYILRYMKLVYASVFKTDAHSYIQEIQVENISIQLYAQVHCFGRHVAHSCGTDALVHSELILKRSVVIEEEYAVVNELK